MKIYNITPIKFNITNNKIEQSKNKKEDINNNILKNNYGKLPSTNQYLAFTGGYSLDLGQTIKQLDKLAQKNSSVYPPNIREWAGMILDEGNKTKETLISIHKKYFANLKECFSLDEIKSKFPEFKDVISSDNAKISKGSFIMQKFLKVHL